MAALSFTRMSSMEASTVSFSRRGPEYWFTEEISVEPKKHGIGTEQVEWIKEYQGFDDGAYWVSGASLNERFAQSVLPFAQQYLSCINNGVHKTICELFDDGLCKLYADLEYYDIPENAASDLDVIIGRFIDLCHSKLASDDPFSKDDVIVLYSERPGKKSAHLIFPVVFRSSHEVGNFVEHLVDETKQSPGDLRIFGLADDKWAVDTGVYGRGKSLRIYGAVKIDDQTSLNNPFLTRKEHEVQDALAAEWEAGGREGKFPTYPRSLRILLRTLMGANVLSQDELDALPPLLRDNLRVISGVWSFPSGSGHKRRRQLFAEPLPFDPVPLGPVGEDPYEKRFHAFFDSNRLFKRLKTDNYLGVGQGGLINEQSEGQRQGTVHIFANPLVQCPNPHRMPHSNDGARFRLNLTTRWGDFRCANRACGHKWGAGKYDEEE